VSFYPDLTLEVRNQRKEYDELLKKCRAANIWYGFLFPAPFKVTSRGINTYVWQPKWVWSVLVKQAPRLRIQNGCVNRAKWLNTGQECVWMSFRSEDQKLGLLWWVLC
jgi:hypothetical protein